MSCALRAAAHRAPRCPAAASFAPIRPSAALRSLSAGCSMTRGRRGAATTAAASPDDVAAVLQRYEELPKAVVFDVSRAWDCEVRNAVALR